MRSNREEARHLAARLGVEPTDLPRIVADSAPAVRQALACGTLLDPVQVPAFLIDDEHLLHGNASPAFLHEVLQTLAEPRTTTAGTRQQTGLPGA